MKVGVDARSLLTEHPRGEGRSLLRLYQEIAIARPEWRVFFYGRTALTPTVPGVANGNVRSFDLSGDRYNLWENLGLPFRAWRDRVEILHCSSSSAPRYSRVPIVLTVHDIIPLLFDDGWSTSAVARFRRQLGYGLHAAKCVIAVSNNTKEDLVREFSLPPDKIRVIHWGVIGANRDIDDRVADATLARLGVKAPYVMAFGGSARRKNTGTVIAAFVDVVRCVADLRLVLVGVGNAAARVKYVTMIERAKCTDRISLLDYVSNEDLAVLYARATCLIYVSLYEGFGLPLLEAMSAGVPVIASNTTSIPEIAGDAAVLVDPSNSPQISAATIDLVGNNTLRLTMRRKGLERAKCFSWHAAAKATIEVFESVTQ